MFGKRHPISDEDVETELMMMRESTSIATITTPTMRWTVWKRSSMGFVGMDGFSVYNAEGKLSFRIDNYCRRQKRVLLMDAAGRALLSLKPKMLSMHDQWDVYEGEEKKGMGHAKTGSKKPLFSMRRPSILYCKMDVAEVFMNGRITDEEETRFWVEGSFRRRSCRIIRQRRGNYEEMVAHICRKRANSLIALGDDVFTLNVKAGVDCELIMAFVVVMDRMCRK